MAYGARCFHLAKSVLFRSDGGFIVAGFTTSFGAGSADAWLLKLDSSGSIVWQKTYGGTGDDEAFSVRQTSDGGFIVAGVTFSFGAGGPDAWVLRLDGSGTVDNGCGVAATSTATGT